MFSKNERTILLLGCLGGLKTIESNVLSVVTNSNSFAISTIIFGKYFYSEIIVDMISFMLFTLGFIIISKKESNKVLYWTSLGMLFMFLIPPNFFGNPLVYTSLFSFAFGTGLLRLRKLIPLSKYAGILSIAVTPLMVITLILVPWDAPSFLNTLMGAIYVIKLILESYLLYKAREVYK